MHTPPLTADYGEQLLITDQLTVSWGPCSPDIDRPPEPPSRLLLQGRSCLHYDCVCWMNRELF